jgi:hypothetical protein
METIAIASNNQGTAANYDSKSARRETRQQSLGQTHHSNQKLSHDENQMVNNGSEIVGTKICLSYYIKTMTFSNHQQKTLWIFSGHEAVHNSSDYLNEAESQSSCYQMLEAEWYEDCTENQTEVPLERSHFTNQLVKREVMQEWLLHAALIPDVKHTLFQSSYQYISDIDEHLAITVCQPLLRTMMPLSATNLMIIS